MGEADNRDTIKKKEIKDRLSRREQLEDIAWVLGTVQGRRFYWRFLERAGIFRTSIDGNPYLTYRNEGERNIGLMLIADMNDADPTAYLKCLSENKLDQNQQ